MMRFVFCHNRPLRISTHGACQSLQAIRYAHVSRERRIETSNGQVYGRPPAAHVPEQVAQSWRNFLGQEHDDCLSLLSAHISSRCQMEQRSAYRAVCSYWSRRLEIWDEYEKSMKPIKAEMEMIRLGEFRLRSVKAGKRQWLHQEYTRRIRHSHARPPFAQLNPKFNVHPGLIHVSAEGTDAQDRKATAINTQVASRRISSLSWRAGISKHFYRASPSTVGTVFNRRFCFTPRALQVPDHVQRFYKERYDDWKKKLERFSKKRFWSNLIEVLDDVEKGYRRSMDVNRQHEKLSIEEVEAADGTAKEMLKLQLAVTRAFNTVREQALPFRINSTFLGEVGWGFLYSPYPQLKRLAYQTLAISYELENHEASLTWLRNTYNNLLLNEKEGRYALACYPSDKLSRRIIDANAILYKLIRDMIDYPQGAQSHRLQNSLKSHHQKISNFSAWYPHSKHSLAAMAVRRHPRVGAQAVYNSFSFAFGILIVKELDLRRTLNRWIHKVKARRTYPRIYRKEAALRHAIRELKDCGSDFNTLVSKEAFKGVFARRLDFLDETEMAHRTKIAQQMWVSYWRVTREYDDRMAKIEADLNKARKIGDESRKKQKRGKEAKRGKREDRYFGDSISGDNDRSTWWRRIESGKSKRDKKQGKTKSP